VVEERAAAEKANNQQRIANHFGCLSVITHFSLTCPHIIVLFNPID